ncbi:regulator of sigma E protease [Rhodobacter sp. JA431]|uniref:RIP metalloprotease RseP n=1 Tax=Rhodobacter sp. JA431 TaxID=570013 RepID=UPI000BD4C7C1|nr:RIP metalloprotease RseP [Rhodobacter sp. JA431]SOC14259.1 regulator of sigma E protease [Rhodobacter sp. JA431]
MEFLPDFGNLLYTIIAFILALSVIVTVHEYGHYIIGRICGIKAEAFSIGFGPTLISRKDKHGTVWKLSAIPAGGYVKFLGDANAASAGADEGAMAALSAAERRQTMHGAPLWARAATVAAGPAFNFILSIFVFGAAIWWQGTAVEPPRVAEIVALPNGSGDLRPGDAVLAIEGVDLPDYSALMDIPTPEAPFLTYRINRDGADMEVEGPQIAPPRADQVVPQSAGYEAGLLAGDVITAINGQEIWRFEDIVAAVDATKGAPLDLQIWRPGEDGTSETLNITLSPKIIDIPQADGSFTSDYKIGLMAGMGFSPETERGGVGEALVNGTKQTWRTVTASVSAIENMVLGNISSCNLRGAIGIAEGSAAAAKSGLADFIWFIALLSTAVGFINLMPIPVLDGGHLMFHLWEGITGKPPSDRVMSMMVSVGLALVLSLMAFGLWNDISC